MSATDADRRRPRTVALVGHGGCGKTTLAEALLHRAGALQRPGRVEDGTTVSDHEPEEAAHGMSVTLGVLSLPWTAPGGTPCTVTLLDAPGHPDFAGAVDAALSVADAAVVVVSAVDGVAAGTRAAWAAAASAGVPRLVVVTQEDRARADFHGTLDALRDAFGAGVVPLELPLGEEQAFHGVADVLSEHARDYDADGTAHDVDVPDDVAAEEHAVHVEVAEDIVSHDDAQLEAYLAGDEPDAAALGRTLAREVADCEAFPVLVASGVTGAGVDRVADALCELVALRAGRVLLGDVSADDDPVAVPVDPDPAGEPVLHVFRTFADPFVGQVSAFRVLSGTVRAGDRLRNGSTGTEERLHGLFRLQGKEHVPADDVLAGEVAAVAKLTGTPTGTLLWARPGAARPAGPVPRRPVHGLAVAPVSQADDDRMSTALARLVADDPSLAVERAGDATVLRGLGDTHLTVALERLARLFGVHVTTGPVPVAYRETAARPAEAEGKVKKQSGGHGQFAVVRLRVAPRPAGSGTELVDAVVGGAIPRAFLPAVEKGVVDALASGGPQGHPVVDVRVEVFDGKAHSVDSSEAAFRAAAAAGVREVLAAAGTVVLEPVSRVTVTVPSDLQGAVLTDLSGRRGHVVATDQGADGATRVVAHVPEVELARYVLDLRSLTGARADLAVEHDHYEAVPARR